MLWAHLGTWNLQHEENDISLHASGRWTCRMVAEKVELVFRGFLFLMANRLRHVCV